MSLFSELKRRNVFRVALLYLVTSWLVIQVADVAISMLALPAWTGRFVFLLLLMGLPLVLVFSWVYEITPEGVKREKDVDRSESITAETGRKLNVALVVLLVVAIAGLALDRLVPETGMPAAADLDTVPPTANSIAVLPFVNMSPDPENEYFSDGLSEELLNLLAKIPNLKVAARTSAFSFKGADASISEIAAALNVTHVLEGSVRRSGDDIRITAQLIKASDGYHLWSETWDRTLVDVFAIQDEIATAVVDALRIRLLGELPKVRTIDPRAYELYLRAKASSNLRTAEGFQQAAALLTEALAIDTDSADGWVELAVVQVNLAGHGVIPMEEGYARARVASERALRIEPGHPGAMSNLGWVAMYGEWDFAKAARYIGHAVRQAPGDARVLNTSAVISGILGRREAMIATYERALELDPVAMNVLNNLAGSYLLSSERYEDALPLLDTIREVSPESIMGDVIEGYYLLVTGRPAEAVGFLEAAGGPFGAFGLAAAFHDLSQREESDAALATLVESGRFYAQVAALYAYRGETEPAFEWLERGYAVRDDSIVEIRMHRWLESLYEDPRWESLLRRIGISDADAAVIDL